MAPSNAQSASLRQRVTRAISSFRRELRSGLSYVPFGSPGAWGIFGGGRVSDAGEVVNESTALSVATVYSCVRILSESVAALPLRLYRRTPQGRIQAFDQPLHYLLSVQPNPEMSAFGMVETIVKSLMLAGNAYVEIERDTRDGVYGLWPLDPRQTYPIRGEDGSLWYRTSDGEQPGHTRDLPAQDILHIPLFPGYDGIVGLSPLQVSMQSFGIAIAMDRFSGRFFANFATPSIVLTTPEEVDPHTKGLFREEWQKLQSGPNAHRMAVLDQGMDIKTISLSPDEIQFVESRKLLREDIAGIFRVPLFMLGSSERLSQASAEQISLSFVTDTLRPIVDRICGECTRKLLRPQPGQAVEFVLEADFSSRLRGDTTAQVAYYSKAITSGWMSPNEVRRELNLNEGPAALNVYQCPVTQQSVDRLLDTPPQQHATVPADTTVEQ